jgi:hypothetical protein
MSWVYGWVDVLAAQQYEFALAMVDPGHGYTVDMLRNTIEGYMAASKGGKISKVTPCASAQLPPHMAAANQNEFPYRLIFRDEDDGSPTWFDFTLPADGYWSGLVARFVFYPDGDEMKLYLNEVLY